MNNKTRTVADGEGERRTPPFLGTRMTVTVLFVLMSLDISTCNRSLPTTSKTLTAVHFQLRSPSLTLARGLTFEFSHASRDHCMLILLCKLRWSIYKDPTSPKPFITTLFDSPPHYVPQSGEERFSQPIISAPFGVSVKEADSARHWSKRV